MMQALTGSIRALTSSDPRPLSGANLFWYHAFDYHTNYWTPPVTLYLDRISAAFVLQPSGPFTQMALIGAVPVLAMGSL